MSRWSSYHSACTAFINSWKKLLKTLNDVVSNTSQKSTNCKKAVGLKEQFK